MDIASAIEVFTKANVVVTGYLISETPGIVYLCSELLESYPPQCGEPSLLVQGLSLETIGPLQQSEGTNWTSNTLSLRGDLKEGVLHASPP